jgi:acyl-ACP thioesterase
VSAQSPSELVAIPARGRVFSQPVRPGLADCAPSGRARLEALARWLQDVAYADVEDAGLAASAVWVVRRTRIRVDRFPRFAEHLVAQTFCSGTGRAWAERRTSIHGTEDGGADVEAVSLWVHLDPADWRPMPFSDRELAIYGEAAGERKISARLRHPQPPPGANRSGWNFRATECDVADHVNNAAYWIPLEEEVLTREAAEPTAVDVEIEFRTPAQPGPKQVLESGARRWIVGVDDEVHASILLADWPAAGSGDRERHHAGLEVEQ